MIASYCTDCCFCSLCDIGIRGYTLISLCLFYVHTLGIEDLNFFLSMYLWIFDKKKLKKKSLFIVSTFTGGGGSVLLVSNYQEFSKNNFLQDDCTESLLMP